MVKKEVIFSAENIIHSYPQVNVLALNDVSFSLTASQCCGLVGANGAGKTSLISVMAGVLKPSRGKVCILKESNPTRPSYTKKLGVVPQDIALYDNLTGYENLQYFGAMYAIPSKKLKTIIEEKLKLFGLYDRKDDRVKVYSGGMKRRLNILASLLHNPQLVILDEPLVGVDVLSRTVILEAFKKLRDSGVSILYTSHHMKEVEEMCDEIIVLNKGVIVAQNTPGKLLAAHPSCTDMYDLFLKLTEDKGEG